MSKQYKPRGAVPRRKCAKFTILLEPTLGLRLKWLADQNVSYCTLIEKIVANDREVQSVKV